MCWSAKDQLDSDFSNVLKTEENRDKQVRTNNFEYPP